MAWIRKICLWMSCLIFLGASSTPQSKAADDTKLPRYQLKPGEVLNYKGQVKFKYDRGAYVEETETTAWVVRRNPDGSSRIILRTGSRLRTAKDMDAIEEILKKNDAPAMEFRIGSIDLFPNGRLGPEGEIGPDLDPAMVFPQLPLKISESTWSQQNPRTGYEYGYSSLQREPKGWKFNAERQGSDKTIHGITFTSTYHLERGKVFTVEQKFTQEIGLIGQGEGTFKLTSAETMTAAKIAAFGKAVDKFIAATKAYEKSARASARDLANCSTLLSDAKLKLVAARDAIDQPLLREEIDRKLAKYDITMESCLKSAERRSRIVGVASPEWSLQDLDGKIHALSEYRGQVLVLDFWYRGCGWCVKAMPEFNKLAERFEGRPVTILGMNIDPKEEDARFVADTMKLKYKTLRAVDIPAKYEIVGFPTFVVIDPDGIVRDIHAGYSPVLGEELIATIERLLKNTPQQALNR